MKEDIYELTTEDLVLEEPKPGAKLPTPQQRSAISVTGAAAAPQAEPAKPRFVPTARAAPIKEKSKQRIEEKKEPTSMATKAASFFEQAQEAEQAGDKAGAIRHIKMAITFDPSELKYQDMLRRLGGR